MATQLLLRSARVGVASAAVRTRAPTNKRHQRIIISHHDPAASDRRGGARPQCSGGAAYVRTGHRRHLHRPKHRVGPLPRCNASLHAPALAVCGATRGMVGMVLQVHVYGGALGGCGAPSSA